MQNKGTGSTCDDLVVRYQAVSLPEQLLLECSAILLDPSLRQTTPMHPEDRDALPLVGAPRRRHPNELTRVGTALDPAGDNTIPFRDQVDDLDLIGNAVQ